MTRGEYCEQYGDQVTRFPSGQARPAIARQVTIQDVARAAAVSRQTVSNVLNGSGRVGDAARARVLEAVATLGYHPNHGARSLRSRRTWQVAYVLPRVQLFPGNYIMQEFLQALAAASARRGYSMVIVVPDGDPRDDLRRLIASRSVDAFLLSELQQDDVRVALLAEAGVPFAGFGRTSPALSRQWVDIDNREGIAAAVEHVLARGFGRVAYLGYRTENHWDVERAAGFRAGLARHAVPADQAEMLLVDDSGARSEGPVAARFQPARPSPGRHRDQQRPARRGRLQRGGGTAAADRPGSRRHRLRRSVAAGLMHPRLTSVAIPVDDIARRVVARALKQLDHGPDQQPGEVVPARLRLGESTSGFGLAVSRAEERAVQAQEGAGDRTGRGR